MDKIVALVPMRHHSQRVKGKNYRPLAGIPLYQHILSTLVSCPGIAEIVVDTDSEVVIDGIKDKYPEIKVVNRPEHLRAEETPMNEVLMYDTARVEADFYLQTHSTNPLLTATTISTAIQIMEEQYPAYDTLFSVTRRQTRYWDQLGRAINHNPAILLQTQDLPPVFEENSCLYIFTRKTLELHRNRIGLRPYMYEIDAEEAWDIDEEIDFKIVDLLLSQE